ncbi:MAG: hypothetical protein NTW08_07760 [Gammaproteobacteria bacterium]|nr:hypothetical protein [Gammaproteobacteria bacterium]
MSTINNQVLLGWAFDSDKKNRFLSYREDDSIFTITVPVVLKALMREKLTAYLSESPELKMRAMGSGDIALDVQKIAGRETEVARVMQEAILLDRRWMTEINKELTMQLGRCVSDEARRRDVSLQALHGEGVTIQARLNLLIEDKSLSAAALFLEVDRLQLGAYKIKVGAAIEAHKKRKPLSPDAFLNLLKPLSAPFITLEADANGGGLSLSFDPSLLALDYAQIRTQLAPFLLQDSDSAQASSHRFRLDAAKMASLDPELIARKLKSTVHQQQKTCLSKALQEQERQMNRLLSGPASASHPALIELITLGTDLSTKLKNLNQSQETFSLGDLLEPLIEAGTFSKKVDSLLETLAREKTATSTLPRNSVFAREVETPLSILLKEKLISLPQQSGPDQKGLPVISFNPTFDVLSSIMKAVYPKWHARAFKTEDAIGYSVDQTTFSLPNQATSEKFTQVILERLEDFANVLTLDIDNQIDRCRSEPARKQDARLQAIAARGEKIKDLASITTPLALVQKIVEARVYIQSVNEAIESFKTQPRGPGR